MPRVTYVLLCAWLALTPATSRAHYLWVSLAKTTPTTVDVYFEEGPGPGDGEYLDPFVKRGTTWVRTLDGGKPAPLQMKEVTKNKNRWLQGMLSKPAPCSVDSYGKWGVYRYGKTDVLLHYYARYLAVKSHDDLHELARASQMDLDIVPHDEDGALRVTVFWKGKPAAGRDLYIRGPRGFNTRLKTDDRGRAKFDLKAPGRYTVRTYVEEPENSGTFEGKAYEKVRHNATLILDLPLES